MKGKGVVMSRIIASSEDLYTQSFQTAEECFKKAVKVIDDEFGKDYSKKHPEIVGIYMQTIVKDFNTSIIGKKLQEIGDSLNYLADRVEDLR